MYHKGKYERELQAFFIAFLCFFKSAALIWNKGWSAIQGSGLVRVYLPIIRMPIGKGMTISHVVLFTTTHLEMSADLLMHSPTPACCRRVSINQVGAKQVCQEMRKSK